MSAAAVTTRRRDRLRAMLARLGGFYIAMLALAVLLGHGFLELAEHALDADAQAFNTWVLTNIHAHASPLRDQAALALAVIGGVPGIIMVGLVFGGWLWWRGRIIDVVTLAASLGGCAVLTWGCKVWFTIPRPMLFPRLVEELSFSFPSGHSSMSMALYAFIGGWLVLQAPRQAWRWLAGSACVAFAVAIGASRMYLGVHWPTDVAGGFTIALAWLSACLAGRHWLKSRYGVPTTESPPASG